MKTRKGVPAAETGAISSDYRGTRGMFMPKGTSRDTEKGKTGSGGLAPKPSGGAALLGNDRPSAGTVASMARVPSAGSLPTGTSGGSFTPVQNNAMANLRNSRVGQENPDTSAAASSKPKRKGLGSAFFGEY